MIQSRILRAGSARTCITPPVGTPLGGNARLDNYASGIWKDLHARALWLEDCDSSFCVVSLDLLGLWGPDAARLRHAVADQLQIGFEHVMIACTHTHSGPDTLLSLCWHDEKVAHDSKLLEPFWGILTKGVLGAATAARRMACSVTVEYGTSMNPDIGHCRRLRMKSGETRMNWELPPAEDVDSALSPTDPQVSVLVFRDSGEAIVGAIVHYACHPAILAGANTMVSGDYCGLAMETLELEWASVQSSSGRRPTHWNSPAALFLQGAAGNINHIDYQYPERGRGEGEVVRCAELLAGSARQAISDSTQVSSPRIRSAYREMLLPIRPFPPEEVAAAREIISRYDGSDISLADGIPPEVGARKLLKLDQAASTGRYPGRFAQMRNGQVVVPTQVLRVGGITFGAVAAEIFCEFGLQLREITNDRRCLLVSLANGLTCYVPTPEAYLQGGYEPSHGPSFLHHDAGDRMVKQLAEMVQGNT